MEMGFFADVGPLRVFVSHQVRGYRNSSAFVKLINHLKLIHHDLKFDPNSNPPSYASDEQVGLLSCLTAEVHY